MLYNATMCHYFTERSRVPSGHACFICSDRRSVHSRPTLVRRRYSERTGSCNEFEERIGVHGPGGETSESGC